MNILFVMEHRNNAGNTHAIANYMRVGKELGHHIAFFGPARPDMPGVNFSTDPRAFDRVVYLFESKLYRLNRLQEVGLLGSQPRHHRYILDADARHNPIVVVDGYDRNFRDEEERAEWLEFYGVLTDQIIKPTLLASCDPRVTTLPFFGFDPSLVLPPEASPPKAYDILHVGHNWWRWKEVSEEIIPAFEKIRDQVGEIGFLGLWWDKVPEWAEGERLEAAFRLDTDAFRRLRIRAEAAVPYQGVIRAMSTGRVNIFTQRPVLAHLQHLTGRYFEEFCADTIPLLMLDTDLAVAVFGPAARELTLPGRVAEKLLDALQRPAYYRDIVEDVRRHLTKHHLYHHRVEELVAALKH